MNTSDFYMLTAQMWIVGANNANTSTRFFSMIFIGVVFMLISFAAPKK